MFNVSETRIYIYALSLDAKMTQAIHVKKYIILQRVPGGRGVGGQQLSARISIDLLRLIQFIKISSYRFVFN